MLSWKFTYISPRYSPNFADYMNFLNIEYSGNCFFENNSNIRDIFYHKPEDLHIHFMEFIDSKKVSRYSRAKNIQNQVLI